MSALLSSLSPSQSHINYVRIMSLNSNQGKFIPSVVFFKNSKFALELFFVKNYDIASACAQLVTVPSSDLPIVVI